MTVHGRKTGGISLTGIQFTFFSFVVVVVTAFLAAAAASDFIKSSAASDIANTPDCTGGIKYIYNKTTL